MNAKSKKTTIDPDDVPELTDEFLEKGVWRIGDKIVSREEAQLEAAKRRSRSSTGAKKISTDIVLDADVLAAFQALGGDWEARMNHALRDWLTSH
jgi:uncharacterized protein (DUF4415 family)